MTVNLPGRRLGQGSLVKFISQLLLEVHRRRFGLALRCREMILWIRFYGFNLGLGQISRLHHIQVILCCTSLFTLAMPDG
ncbi:hypothetical protein BHYA_0006g00690 [Botrytis hyacinthi]|uniref:Uncharacterized protein n=1 Tax=Botrytis hyacinthi TaxID=278943 RepID=A0A4Z1H0M1_9HELO|nr:hypothetical protein BHYA_0006g00690 [Botrytis hyacinthi]